MSPWRASKRGRSDSSSATASSHRTRLTVFFRLLLAMPVLVWLVLRGVAAFVVGIRELARRPRPGRSAGQPARLRRVLRAICDPGERVRVPRSRPLSVVPVPTGLSDRPRDRLARSSGPLGRVLPPRPRSARTPPRDCTRRRLRDRLVEPGLVVGVIERSARKRSGGTCRPSAASPQQLHSSRGSRSSCAAAHRVACATSRRSRSGTPRRQAHTSSSSHRGIRRPIRSSRSRTRSSPSTLSASSSPTTSSGRASPSSSASSSRFPHFIWIMLWSIAVVFVVVVAWIAALATGRVPDPLHRFLAAYVRYATHLVAFVYLIGRRFPGFTGRAGSYGIDLEIDPATSQSRWQTLFRFFLAIPAFILAGALGGVALVIAFLAWWYALATGRMPEGMRNLGAACLRYSAQTYAYALLVTSRYPYGAPILREPEAAADETPVGTAPSETRSEGRLRRARRRGARGRCVPPLSDCRPGRSQRSARSTSTLCSAQTSSSARSATSASSTSLWILAQIALLAHALDLRAAWRPARARVVRRPDRDGDAARDARARHRLARSPAVRARGALVDTSQRPERPELPRLAASRTGRSSPRSSSRSASRSSS